MTNTPKYIVHGPGSGTYYGEIVGEWKGAEVEMTNVRNIHYWHGACSLLQIAEEGLEPTGQRLSMPAKSLVIIDATIVLKCSEAAQARLDKVPQWKA